MFQQSIDCFTPNILAIFLWREHKRKAGAWKEQIQSYNDIGVCWTLGQIRLPMGSGPIFSRNIFPLHLTINDLKVITMRYHLPGTHNFIPTFPLVST
uniref:Uncharacterized protein n=1 Tax=Arundo donax TaxID=35708 RepID=A0A0A9FWP8_ARUDO